MKSKLILCMLLSMSISMNAFSFGSSGSDGSSGRDGANGIDAPEKTVIASAGSFELILNGTNGSNGSNATAGSSASGCYQPTGFSDEYGADGGDGGSGGDGGRGGDGGAVTIFYKSQAELKNIYIENQGGFGAEAGYGAEGGYGCSCSTSSWSHTRCENVESCSTSETCSSERVCEDTGTTRTQDGHTAPARVCHDRRTCTPTRSCHTENVCTDYRFSCSSGSNGRSGSKGSNGRDGYWGNIKLVKNITELPGEYPTTSISLINASESDIELTKQIWVAKTGLKALIADGSIISNNYSEYIKLAHRKFRFVWDVERDISSFSDMKISLNFDGEKIDFNIEGEDFLQFTSEEIEGVTLVTVTSAYKTSEIKNLEIYDTKGYGKDLVLVIKDNESISNLVKTEISLQFVFKPFIGFWNVVFDGKVAKEFINIYPDRIEVLAGKLGIDSKYIKRKKKVRYTLKVKRSFGNNSTSLELFQSKIKL